MSEAESTPPAANPALKLTLLHQQEVSQGDSGRPTPKKAHMQTDIEQAQKIITINKTRTFT
jgi:hypothetical protein